MVSYGVCVHIKKEKSFDFGGSAMTTSNSNPGTEDMFSKAVSPSRVHARWRCYVTCMASGQIASHSIQPYGSGDISKGRLMR